MITADGPICAYETTTAPSMMKARQPAATDVRWRLIPVSPGRISPAAPSTSKPPIIRRKIIMLADGIGSVGVARICSGAATSFNPPAKR